MIRYYANKIVEDGLYDTETFSICVYFDEYKDEEFIKEHKEEILNLINLDEKVADVEVDENCFDMVFYLDYCPYYYENEIEDKLNEQKVRFALSNVLSSKGNTNSILTDWLNKNPEYKCHHLNFDYKNSNYHKADKTDKADEVLIMNY